MLGQLSGSVAHELRNPLGVISNCVYFLTNAQDGMNDDARECLEDIGREVNTANRIVGELLDFARPPKLDLQGTTARTLIEEALGMIEMPAGIDLCVAVDETCSLTTDCGQMVRVLRNLMLNAVQAMNGEGGLNISCQVDGEVILFAIADTGPGIAAEERETLFEPLVSSKARGIGLGLPLSRRYAELNGGSLDVDSAHGQGAVFRLTLPVEPPDS